MKLRKFLLPFILVSAISPAAFGSVYISNFAGSGLGDPLDGVDGWVQSEPNTDGKLSWVSDHAGLLAGTIGSYYGEPTVAPYNVSHTIGVPLVGSQLDMRFGIQDSTTDWTGRNDFYIRVLGTGDVNLFSLNFIATNQDVDYDDPLDPTDPATANTQWDMNWSTGVTSSDTFKGIIEDGSYTFSLTFAQNVGTPADVDFTLSMVGPLNTYTKTETISGLSGTTFAKLQVGVDQGASPTWGDNFIAFAGIPEPTSSALLCLATLGFLTRRRRNA